MNRLLAKTLIVLELLSVLPMARVHGQAPAYDAVTIKPNKSGAGRTSISTDDGRFQATNVSIRQLMVDAYGVRSGLISGVSGWADSARYDINAKQVDYDPRVKQTKEQHSAMLAAILEERFHVKVHVEVKQLSVYELVVSKDGPKFKENPAPPAADPADAKKASDRGNMGVNSHNGNVELTGTAVSVKNLVSSLSNMVDLTVIDKTGLKGEYDFHLKWTADNAPLPLPEDAAPVLLTALQEQLGLKLVPAKGPVDTLVVDRVEPPTEN